MSVGPVCVAQRKRGLPVTIKPRTELCALVEKSFTPICSTRRPDLLDPHRDIGAPSCYSWAPLWAHDNLDRRRTR